MRDWLIKVKRTLKNIGIADIRSHYPYTWGDPRTEDRAPKEEDPRADI